MKATCPLCGKSAVLGFTSAKCAGLDCPNFASDVFADWLGSLPTLPAPTKDDDYGDPDQWTRLYNGTWKMP